MDKVLNVISNTGSGCGGCTTTGCGTCSTTAPKVEAPTVLSRRHFGYTALAASAAALLAGCSKQEPPAEAAAPQPASPAKKCPKSARVDLDTAISAMALTAKEMNAKYKETSEGGLAVSLVLC
jgi:L-serine deaminase